MTKQLCQNATWFNFSSTDKPGVESLVGARRQNPGSSVDQDISVSHLQVQQDHQCNFKILDPAARHSGPPLGSSPTRRANGQPTITARKLLCEIFNQKN